MAMDAAAKRALVLGAGAGALTGLVVWLLVEQEIRNVLREEVPPMVQSEMASTLQAAGLDPATGRRIASMAESLDRIGIL